MALSSLRNPPCCFDLARMVTSRASRVPEIRCVSFDAMLSLDLQACHIFRARLSGLINEVPTAVLTRAHPRSMNISVSISQAAESMRSLAGFLS